MRLRATIDKNWPELRALVTGRFPAFVTQVRTNAELSEIPVFVFHRVHPETLEGQLNHLHASGYRTLAADDLEREVREPQRSSRQAVLTVDDAHACLWTYAFPLLRRYGLRAIVFAVPGVVPDDPTPYPNLDNVAAGQASMSQLARRLALQPLCTWRELRVMHDSGLVDVQSHSLTHARIAISPRVIDFLHPRYPVQVGNFGVPLAAEDDPARPQRLLRPGAPVFEWASRLAGRRFLESPELVVALREYVRAHGGASFFTRRDWRARLRQVVQAWPGAARGRLESTDETTAAIRLELVRSKSLLEERLPGKVVRHFCYPWYQGTEQSDRLAAEAGYSSVHYGLLTAHEVPPAAGAPVRLRRISEEYLLRLPGKNRAPASHLAAIWLKRARGRLARQVVAT